MSKPNKPKDDAQASDSTNDLSRRAFLGGAAVAGSAALLACGKDDYDWEAAEAAATAQTIVRAAIYPGIGVARIGNSPDGYFIGPEVAEPPLTKAGDSRDASGALKRQAARFRIYGYNASGEIVKELTADDADITWQVHLANKKAAWYRFIVALDIPEASKTSCIRRNASVRGASRSSLVIDPGPTKISGKSASGKKYHFDGGKFMNTPVSLGEARTDDKGRLLVLGGLGNSSSPGATPVYDPKDDDSFNNADGWHDDVADGPVDATVTIAGKSIPVESSWVIVGPPNYAPNVVGWRTLHDLMVDTFVDAGMLSLPPKTSFTQDVLPALRRLSGLQWVNKGFLKSFGPGTENDFDDPAFIAKLAKKSTATADVALRKRIVKAFRPPSADRKAWPPLYGDAYGTFDKSDKNELSMSTLRATHLKRWADGDFLEDWTPQAHPYEKLEDVPLGERPAMLDRAALTFCLADAFHPGCEVTWPVRHASLYKSPFRIKRRDDAKPEPDYGDQLTAAVATRAGGMLDEQGPGCLTRWMALPWQGDTAFCRSGYEPDFDPYLQTFWPARVPNQVLTEADYAVVIDTKQPRATRLAAWNKRSSWMRAVRGSVSTQMNKMVSSFGDMGVIEARPGVANDAQLPEVMFVESLPPNHAKGLASAPPPPDPNTPADIIEAGWNSQEELDEFRRLRVRRG